MPVTGTPTQLRQFIEILVGNRTPQGETMMVKDRNKDEGRLIELADRRRFYVFDSGDSATSATGALGAKIKQGDARVPLTHVLMESPAWYQPERHQGMAADPTTRIHKPYPLDVETMMARRREAQAQHGKDDFGM